MRSGAVQSVPAGQDGYDWLRRGVWRGYFGLVASSYVDKCVDKPTPAAWRGQAPQKCGCPRGNRLHAMERPPSVLLLQPPARYGILSLTQLGLFGAVAALDRFY